MARPSPERLQLSTYPWSFEMPPRFGDMDALRHLNNVAIARIHEDGRVRFQDAIDVRSALAPKHGFLVVEVSVQYLAEGHYPDLLTAACGILRVGRSAFTIGQGLFQHGRCIGTADTTLVYVQRGDSQVTPLPQAACATLLAHQLRQAQTTASQTSREVPHA